MAFDASAIRYNTSPLDVESWSKATGAKGEDLYDFKSNAEEFFGLLAYEKAYKQLLMEEIHTDDNNLQIQLNKQP